MFSLLGGICGLKIGLGGSRRKRGGRLEKLWGPSFGLGKHPASQFDEANDVVIVSKQVAFGTRLPKASPRED